MVWGRGNSPPHTLCTPPQLGLCPSRASVSPSWGHPAAASRPPGHSHWVALGDIDSREEARSVPSSDCPPSPPSPPAPSQSGSRWSHWFALALDTLLFPGVSPGAPQLGLGALRTGGGGQRSLPAPRLGGCVCLGEGQTMHCPRPVPHRVGGVRGWPCPRPEGSVTERGVRVSNVSFASGKRAPGSPERARGVQGCRRGGGGWRRSGGHMPLGAHLSLAPLPLGRDGMSRVGAGCPPGWGLWVGKGVQGHCQPPP